MAGGRILIPLPNTRYAFRRKNSVCARFAVGIFVICFGLSQLYVLNQTEKSTNTVVELNYSAAAILSMVPSMYHKYLTTKTRNQTLALNGTSSASYMDSYRKPDIEQMRRFIRRYNELQSILNEDIFGPLENDSVLIVVQVHTRINYLRHLIVSLAQARDISRSLIIFSHDYYDEDINDLIQSIDFCKVMQIFYPHSIQTHPHEFPGVEPDDCPRDIKRDQAIIRKCTNANYPDLYGHYREASFTQTKHHWWWKANRIFDQIAATQHHTGAVLFLEEDHYVSEDFIYLLELMQRKANDLCGKCNILSLGTYLKTLNYYTYNNNHKVEITPWVSSKHNMGFSFNRSTWREIVQCSKYFCTYDDYNWDWSLQHASQNCLKHKLHAMVVKGPRVFHIGECGVHHRKRNCESNQVISKVQQVLKIATRSGQLFPKSLTLTVASILKKTKSRKGNGGWGDRRDHTLCLNMTISTGLIKSKRKL